MDVLADTENLISFVSFWVCPLGEKEKLLYLKIGLTQR